MRTRKAIDPKRTWAQLWCLRSIRPVEMDIAWGPTTLRDMINRGYLSSTWAWIAYEAYVGHRHESMGTNYFEWFSHMNEFHPEVIREVPTLDDICEWSPWQRRKWTIRNTLNNLFCRTKWFHP